MARSSEGILIGFPQAEDAGAIATRVTEHNVTQANNLMQTGRENTRLDERQGWQRQLQPYRLQQAADEQQMNQMKLDEAADQVKRNSAARQEWETLTARFGTDNPPTAEEIMVAHANMAVARRDPGAASSAINTLAQMKQGDERGTDLAALVVKTTPMLGTLHTMKGLEDLAKALEEHPKAVSTPTYQTLWKTLLQSYEKVLPKGEPVEAMQEYRILRSQGMDVRAAWNKALSTRPEADRYFAQKGNLPDEIKSALTQEGKVEGEESKQAAIEERQSRIVAQREAAKQESALKIQEAKAKSAKELEEYRQGSRRDMANLNARLRQHGGKDDMKSAASVTNQALVRSQREIASLTKQLTSAKDEDREGIQERLNIQYGLQDTLQDTLGKISDAATKKAGVEPPAGGTPKVTPTPEAKADKTLEPHVKAIETALGRAKQRQGAQFNRDTELRKAINVLIEGGTITKDQGIAIYRQQSGAGK